MANADTQSPGIINSVAAINTNEAWAVGNTLRNDLYDQTLFEHWNGKIWQVIPGATIPQTNPATHAVPMGVAEIATNNVWVVGRIFNIITGNQPLIEHWNGTNWRLVPAARGTSQLQGISALASNNIWALGSSGGGTDQSSSLPLVENWNGVAWSAIKTPINTSTTQFSAIVALSSNNVWIAGEQGNATLFEHWNGTDWSITPSPNITVSQGFSTTYMNSIRALTPDDIWSVGYVNNYSSSGSINIPLIEHWNGKTWKLIQSPAGNIVLSAVAGHTAHDVWAIGYQPGQTIFEHWNGKNWSLVAVPELQGATLNDLTIIPNSSGLLVGGGTFGTELPILADHF
ncbi:hypothetical protein [Tengunoibacter tsumagoiensis]|uniref:Photosynthesis system II assembly factor Ycf48/Hcf136-like domain-containing protein n=1 Tax=Tengunoibacter tsumagoiensis TaxID=2014871 RepID=A0A402A637_9CHLR|nr:hypothetical protein [Tengunoibacter tsumagoiensis]GCE14451.1 hypothetical protein KTT_43100 [Tengunoibacter tsumagoiensis]